MGELYITARCNGKTLTMIKRLALFNRSIPVVVPNNKIADYIQSMSKYYGYDIPNIIVGGFSERVN